MNNNINNENPKNIDLTTIITTAIQIPGIKITREAFLMEQFKDKDQDTISLIIKNGPVVAGCDREELRRKAQNIIAECTAFSTSASFLAGLPGGFAMLATMPADMLQFYGVALRMAQQLVYLYGEEDMWCGNTPDHKKVTDQLILYCGVMLGASGAAQTVRVMCSALAKQALKKIPQKALTKTFYYPIIQSILKFFGVYLTKGSFAKGVAKVIPVVGAVVSGGITLASILPMGSRLLDTLDKAHFDYSDSDMEKDIEEIIEVCAKLEEEEATDTEAETADTITIENEETESSSIEETVIEVEPTETTHIENEETESSSIEENIIQVKPTEVTVTQREETNIDNSSVNKTNNTESQPIEKILAQIEKTKEMLDKGIITEEEFSIIKSKLIAQI